MAELWTEAALGWLRGAAGGGLVLLAGLLLMRLVRQPARRQRAGAWAVRAAVLAAVLSLLPGWLPLPVTLPQPVAELAQQSSDVPESAPAVTAKAPETPPPAQPPVAPEPTTEEAPAFAILVVPDGADFPAPAEEVAPAPSPAAPPAAPRSRDAASGAPPPPAGRAVVAVAVNAALLAYGMLAAFGLGRLLLGQVALWRLQRSARPAPAAVAARFAALASGFARRPRLLVSNRVSGPICYGLFRPTVLLPAALAEKADARTLRWVFAHELDHLRRGDPRTGWWAGVAQALYFFWPWFWPLRRELRLAQEYLADAAACAGRESDPAPQAADYAAFLISLLDATRAPVGATGVQARPTELFRRVTMLLKESGRVEGRCPRRWSLVAGGGLLALAVIFAGVHLKASAVPAVPAAPAPADPTKKEEPKPADPAAKEAPKPADPAKPPAAVPRPVVPRGPDMQRLRDAMQKAQNDQAAMQKRLREMMKQMRPPLPPGVADPFAEMDRVMEQLQKQMQLQLPQLQPGMFPNGGIRWGVINPNFNPPFGGNNAPFGAPKTRDGRLGVMVEKPSGALTDQLDLPKGQGLVVEEVTPDSAAARAGIKKHDILLEVAGKPVPSEAGDLAKALKDVKPDQAVDVVVLRKGRKETIKGVKLPEAKAEAPAANQPGAFPGFRPGGVGVPNVPIPSINIQFPNVPFPNLPGAFPGQANVQARSSVRIENGNFTIEHQQGAETITIKGTKEDGRPKASEIEVKDGGQTIKSNTVEGLPAKYQPTVKKLLDSVR